MKKVLFLPFLQIPSGHHQVVDALREDLEVNYSGLVFDKIDVLHYGYGKLESLISGIYLKWIHHFPSTYSWLYKSSVYSGASINKNYKLYELLFIHFIKKILLETKPDIVVCSHALPSYMLNQLKKRGFTSVPIVNVYTDFFVHSFWGTNYIDYHFVSNRNMKNDLITRGITENQIYVTGIPLHRKILQQTHSRSIPSKPQLQCTIMGGSLGVGVIDRLINKLKPTGQIIYHILCGKNTKLYNQLKNQSCKYIHPLPYISSREEMDTIYCQSDFIITKPGGVTVSECLQKRVPIFVYHALPGQEEINLNELNKLGVVFPLTDWELYEDLEQHLLSTYRSEKNLEQYHSSLEQYHGDFHHEPAAVILDRIIQETERKRNAQ
ncbi:UDP-glucuronosyltransferase [Bacillus luteolus]|uniref:UDP-glucuronosyltransferase n=1 Tax=Litchfieldia luteola TaxID=682179 RepID=A0ABR9QNN7_9BACI|nr:glycosyltransferase [Cytobacillus luteolus]MBE4910123.1 UDP-glucuronosyltransferase [Cytobacillus luteolus]MBP1942313.1 UDP-N-acetylglucosamine:LPS N-acetylglucosamine transferase [Cytobacillus luteolus]